jgi:hypothetical protein
MESMRRQVEFLTLENERLQKDLKESLSNLDSTRSAFEKVDDEDGMERAAQLSTLTLDVQRAASETSKIHRKHQAASSTPIKTGKPSVQTAPLLQFSPRDLPPAVDKYSNDFDFALKPQQQHQQHQQPPVPPPLPIYNGELIQAPYSKSTLQKQSVLQDVQPVSPSQSEVSSHALESHSKRVPQVSDVKLESSVVTLAAVIHSSNSSAEPLAAKEAAAQQLGATASIAVPSISSGIMKAARPPSAGAVSERSQSSESSTFSVGEANEG